MSRSLPGRDRAAELPHFGLETTAPMESNLADEYIRDAADPVSVAPRFPTVMLVATWAVPFATKEIAAMPHAPHRRSGDGSSLFS
jgi:hypothetical protein